MKLIGYSFDPELVVIVTSYAERGDFLELLLGLSETDHGASIREWTMRLKLAVDIASGLS